MVISTTELSIPTPKEVTGESGDDPKLRMRKQLWHE